MCIRDRGKTLWAIILVKLFIMFAILKLFFFPDFLAGQSPEERPTVSKSDPAKPSCGFGSVVPPTCCTWAEQRNRNRRRRCV